MVEDAVESPKEMLGKEGDVYKLSTDMDPSGWNNLGCEGHLCIEHGAQSTNREVSRSRIIHTLSDLYFLF